MYVYVRIASGSYAVGHYAPDGEWVEESDWANREDAARRVSWLNGGTGEPFTI